MPNLSEINEKYRGFSRILNSILAQNALQKKRIETYIGTQTEEYFEFVENLSSLLNRTLLVDDASLREATAPYIRMCKDFLREQIRFRKTGKYHVESAEKATESVYANKDVMRYYMEGLLLSYMFWPNHYEIFRFFRLGLPKYPVTQYLEVGVGHGLFTSEILNQYPKLNPNVVDISATSIEVAKEVLHSFGLPVERINFKLGDFLKVELQPNSFDFIVMGEVIEHVDQAPEFLEKTATILRPGGVVYLTTCANCPAIDHVYHFRNVSEIRKLVTESGLNILEDLALPSENIPESRWEEELITINYCAFLQKPLSN